MKIDKKVEVVAYNAPDGVLFHRNTLGREITFSDDGVWYYHDQFAYRTDRIIYIKYEK